MRFLTLFILSAWAFSSYAQVHDYAEALRALARGPYVSFCPTTEFPKVSYALSSSYSNGGANCSKFIDPQGNLGPHGKEIFNHLDKVANNKYFSMMYPGMDTICPRWGMFNKEQKKYFWVWFFAGIAWKESTCKESAINSNATSGTAVGYLQLNEKQAARKWRGDDSGKSCAVDEVRSASKNLKCGIEIFNEQLQGRAGIYEGNGQLGGKGSSSYWQDLRGPGSKILQMVKDFPGCSP